MSSKYNGIKQKGTMVKQKEEVKNGEEDEGGKSGRKKSTLFIVSENDLIAN